MIFDQLIFRKIINFVATRCRILRLKFTKSNFGAGGAYSAPPDPLAGGETRTPPPLSAFQASLFGPSGLNIVWPWSFDLWINACRVTAIEYMCTKFGVDSSSHFPFRAQTVRQMRRNTILTLAGAIQPALLIITLFLLFSFGFVWCYFPWTAWKQLWVAAAEFLYAACPTCCTSHHCLILIMCA